MIEYAHVDQSQCFTETPGQVLVRTARFGNSGRVVVREDNRGRVQFEHAFDDFTRVHGGAVDRAQR